MLWASAAAPSIAVCSATDYDHLAVKVHKPRLVHDRRILVMALIAGLPAVVTSMLVLWLGSYSPRVQWTLTVLIIGVWLGFCFGLRERVASPLRTLANLLEAMREGDYSIRARDSKGDDPLGEVMQQVNAMSATLREQRLGAMEATTLLRKVMEEINVAVFAFDNERRLRLVNRAGERLLNEPAERLLDESAELLGLAAIPGRRPAAHGAAHIPGRHGALGRQPQPVSRRRPAAAAPGGHRSHASFARGGIESLAAPGAGDRARVE